MYIDPKNAIDLKTFFDQKVAQYNQPAFIANDPICIPHRFTQLQDIEIAGFFAALFAWGNRTIIINKTTELLALMDNAPYAFCKHHQDSDLKKLLHFKHRTFQATDILYLIAFLQFHYQQHISLESAFTQWMQPTDVTVENALNGFQRYVFSFMHPYPARTQKHIAAPYKNATCKRLCMYLRWMVRKDASHVDFGLWQNIKPSQLVCPIDLHVASVAERFQLIPKNKINWQTALQLTAYLTLLDPSDPVKYDFALFGLGVIEKY